MALIPCPECKREISDQAEACPGCGMPLDESQRVEFKETTRLTCEAAQALVAFANARGGKVLFGVTDAGRWKGVDIGQCTIERLTGELDGHIYPSLPFEVGRHPAEADREVIRVKVSHDVPPIIGAYLYVSHALDLTKPVDAADIQAYRRVGKTTRKVDFMWLRGRLSSDPIVIVDLLHVRGEEREEDALSKMRCVLWLAPGSGPAYSIRISTDLPLAQEEEVARDLPASTGDRTVTSEFALEFPSERPDKFWLVATYRDDWGCRWESRRRVKVNHDGQAGLRSTSEFSRRIITFPPRHLASPLD